jgi:hypothetical protein
LGRIGTPAWWLAVVLAAHGRAQLTVARRVRRPPDGDSAIESIHRHRNPIRVAARAPSRPSGAAPSGSSRTLRPTWSGGSPVDVDGLAVLIEAILRGVAVQWLADPENVDLDSTIATAQQMLRAVLGQPQPSP